MANPRMTAEIGRVLGGRYRLVAPIGMGASAQVYLADDVKLRRRVALKMLHDALAGDAEFLRRFRAEARAAAALSHPNVMAVYDWSDGSEEGEVAFIVTEYLPGGSLRALLDASGQVSPSQALGVGLEAARALDYAHRRGFVHRDIKPANLLFGEEQRLRIADFGLARALAEAAWTEPQGAVLGTARYASPEQAKGESLSGKADVYSLALVLIEAVTGDVPFVADTTLGTLMARVDRPLLVPESLGPLQSVLAAAGHPDPEQRIDARELAKGLLRAAKRLPRPTPLPLAGALAAGAVQDPDLDPTIHAPLATVGLVNDLTADDLELEPPAWVNQPDADPTAIAQPAFDAASGEASTGDPAPSSAAADRSSQRAEGDGSPAAVTALASDGQGDHEGADPTTARWTDVDAEPPPGAEVETVMVPMASPRPDLDDDPGPDTDEVALVGAGAGAGASPADGVDEPRRARRWPWVLLVFALIAGAGGAAAAVVASSGDGTSKPPIVLPVPTLDGKTETQARALIQASGWKARVVRARRNDTKKGDVLGSSPAAGIRLASGRTITLTVSAGQEIVDVPSNLAGATLEDATKALFVAGLKIDVAERQYSEDVAKDVVIKVADVTPSRIERGSTISVAVSKGPEPRIVPAGLVGSTESAAKEALAQLGLKAAIVRSFSDTVPEGQVISVLPRSGSTVERGTTVNVEVSRGRELIAVPDISGASSIKEAVRILKAAGLKSGSVSGPADGDVRGSSPGAGSMVEPGTKINIILG